ncbi:MAG: sigma-70 family RNA polymerase sigma factor [Polyangiaceae bacterium]|nr:sigma-70 family RNA polymerase sigma factor [Polyangiaceae bacterium]
MSLLSVLLAEAERAPSPSGDAPETREKPGRTLVFEQVYDEHVDLVWRALRRFGVLESALEDATQDVFLVVHRRLAEFEGRSSVSTWLYGIAVGIARNHRRTRRRRPEHTTEGVEDEMVARGASPERGAEDSEALRALDKILSELDPDKREVFVLAELEELTAPEIAAALKLNVNTVYTRLRAARAAFEQALVRFRAKDQGRFPS